MKTTLPQVSSGDRKWHVLDAEKQVVGRLASRAATILMGKGKPSYTPFLDTGDFVIVINAEKVQFSGRKWEQKRYYSHSGYPGSLKEVTAGRLLEQHPDRIIQFAVKGMLPKNKLGRRMLRRLKVYAGPEHPHQAQKPNFIDV